MLPTYLPWIAPISLLISLGLFLYCLLINSRLNKLKKKYAYFMNGQDGTSIERKLFVEVAELREASKSMQQLFDQQAKLFEIQNNTFQKIGFVKYNAFENIGNDLSFSLTLLDGKNNGVCISSLYGRNESRIFSKPIINGNSTIGLSHEETLSLNNAKLNNTNQDSLKSSLKSR